MLACQLIVVAFVAFVAFVICSKSVRKSIARAKTVLHEQTRAAVRKHYQDSKYKPLDLRKKQVS